MAAERLPKAKIPWTTSGDAGILLREREQTIINSWGEEGDDAEQELSFRVFFFSSSPGISLYVCVYDIFKTGGQ